MAFKDGFVWGVATASYQIEGGWQDDGKGPSVWDALCRRPGAVFQGHTGDVACDHYHRYEGDADLLAELGCRAYRFSISWPRVLPEGVGKVNDPGLAFYDRLVDALLARGIEPYVTLFHWDYPLALYHRGGWLHEDSPDWFAEYTRVIVDRLGDRVGFWMTQNEPQCFVGLGHVLGNHAPGLKLGWGEFVTIHRNALLAHGKSVQAIRAHAKRSPKVSFAPVASSSIPASLDPRDIEAAAKHDDVLTHPTYWHRGLFLDPPILGTLPEGFDAVFGRYGVEITDEDLRTIKQPLDYLGLNYYSSQRVRATESGCERLEYPEGYPQTNMGWPVTPDGFYWMVRQHWERYGLPILITENGMASTDWVCDDGSVHDPQRIDFARKYLRELRRAIADGADVLGYLHWSFMDNFEWAEGYSKRFGLVHVDYQTLKRTIKDSGHWYRSVIESNGRNL